MKSDAEYQREAEAEVRALLGEPDVRPASTAYDYFFQSSRNDLRSALKLTTNESDWFRTSTAPAEAL